MSSMVSLRSRERRKSAGARLQSLSQFVSLSQASKKDETAADQARPGTGIPELHTKVPKRRVKSALETRKEQETSDIFNQQQKSLAPVDSKWGVTKYSEDFGPKKRITPTLMRPASSTRRNNPHPSNSFMVWQHPVRIHKHRKAVPPPPDAWRYINEGFYEDYTDNYNTGDAKNEVPITNVAKIKFPGSPRKKTASTTSTATSRVQLLSGVSGTKAQLMPRHISTESKQRLIRPASPQSRMIKGTVKEGSLPIMKEWLKMASSNERELILKMLQAGYNDSEEVRLNKALESILQPDTTEKVQGWLQCASEPERQVLLHVLETLAIATDDNHQASPGFYTIQNYQMNGSDHHHRANSYPITLRPRMTSASHDKSKSHRGSYSKHHQQRPKRKLANTESVAVHDGSAFGLHGRKMTMASKEERGVDLKPEIWHHRILPKHTSAAITHAGGIFNQPQKCRGQHFTHHPEWPTA